MVLGGSCRASSAEIQNDSGSPASSDPYRSLAAGTGPTSISSAHSTCPNPHGISSDSSR